jgi:hypothetical protein
MGSPASFLFSALLVHSDDAWEVPVLEGVLDSGLRALADFPAPLYPPDLEDEIAEALEDLARLDPDSAASPARSLLEVVSRESELTWAARRVLAASGDLETLRLGLQSYFDAPERWREVLAASDDARLRDFDDEGKVEPLSERYILTTLERNLSRARGWLRRNRESAVAPKPPLFPDSGSPLEIKQRVLELYPDARYRAIR